MESTEQQETDSLEQSKPGDIKHLTALLAEKLRPDYLVEDRQRRYLEVREILLDIRDSQSWDEPQVSNRLIVGVRTAPREYGNITNCLLSLNANGWVPHVFAEPESWDMLDKDHLDAGRLYYHWHENKERLGPWRNFNYSSKELLKFLDADFFLMVEDDVVFVPGVREFVYEKVLPYWPKNTGMISLYTPSHYSERQKPGTQFRVSFNNGPNDSMWGACAMLFSRQTLKKFLINRLVDNWKGANNSIHQKPINEREPWEIKNTDTLVGKVLMEQRRSVYYFHPSLCQHVSPVSSIGNLNDTGKRAASCVVDDFGVFEGM